MFPCLRLETVGGRRGTGDGKKQPRAERAPTLASRLPSPATFDCGRGFQPRRERLPHSEGANTPRLPTPASRTSRRTRSRQDAAPTFVEARETGYGRRERNGSARRALHPSPPAPPPPVTLGCGRGFQPRFEKVAREARTDPRLPTPASRTARRRRSRLEAAPTSEGAAGKKRAPRGALGGCPVARRVHGTGENDRKRLSVPRSARGHAPGSRP